MTFGIMESISLIVIIGVLVQWFSEKTKFPSIILLLSIGLIIGPFLKIIDPKAALGSFFNPLIEMSVAIILFEGGLRLNFQEIKDLKMAILRMTTLGTFFAWVIGALVAKYIGDLSWNISFLLSSILVVTGPTVIIPALKENRLNSRISNFLKWEGVINDPIGAGLAVLCFDFIINSSGSGPAFFTTMPLMIKVMLGSGAITYATYLAIKWIFSHHLIGEKLKIPFTLGVVIFLFTVSNHTQEGAGLLCSTMLGVFLANSKLPVIGELKKFNELIGTITISSIFVALAASLDLNVLVNIQRQSIYILIAFLALVRPVAIFLSTMGAEMGFKEKVLVSWFAPRGIVAASLAGTLGPQLVAKGMEEGKLILPIMMTIIFITVVLHSLTLPIMAKKLNLTSGKKGGVLIVGSSIFSIELAKMFKALGIPVTLSHPHFSEKHELDGLDGHFHHGHLLWDLEEEDFELNKFHSLILLNENDHYNSLIYLKLKDHFGRHHIFQFPVAKDDEAYKYSGIPEHSRAPHHKEHEALSLEVLDHSLKEGRKLEIVEIDRRILLENNFNAYLDEEHILLFLIRKELVHFPDEYLDKKKFRPKDRIIVISMPDSGKKELSSST